jgi:hypothetical protein
MLLIAAAATISFHPPAVRVESTATVRIERPATASRQEWERIRTSSRREKIVRDEQGQWVLMRIVDYQ